MVTQGAQILQQLQKYETEKRGSIVGEVECVANEDELLNSQLDTLKIHHQTVETVNADTIEDKKYTSLKILASDKPKFFPPLNFGVIDSDIYRSGFPQIINYSFLKNLKLRTIVYVGEKVNDYEYYKFIKNEGNIQFIHLELKMNDKFDEHNREVLEKIVSIVQVSENLLLLIHSNKGKHRVGMAVGSLRKRVNNWVLAAIYDEYGKYARNARETGGGLHIIDSF